MRRSANRGRPLGARPGKLEGGARLDVVETLRSAAPWQPLRRRETGVPEIAMGGRVLIRRDDFRIKRFKRPAETATVFCVDASGSSAAQRLAEAKGAVELLLAESYVRRDRVALVAFRGTGGELILPPTRSLVRAKRGLAGLPGGGGTPLAAGIDIAAEEAEAARRRGWTPSIVLLTDGRANVTREGVGGRAAAEAEALAAARRVRLSGVAALLIDTSPRANPKAAEIALEMGARYLALPRADAAVLSEAIRATRD
jgi:magnesium chelatase subunit D